MDSIIGNVDDLMLFYKVVQQGSLNRAATLVGLPNSTLSRRLSALERRLGIKLLQVKGKKLAATEQGQLYFQQLSPLLEMLDQQFLNLQEQQRELSGTIRLEMPALMYETWIGDIIERFLLEHPQVRLELRTEQAHSNLLAEDMDLGVCIGPLSDSSLIAQQIFGAPCGLFAHIDYLQCRGKPENLDELSEHALIISQILDRWMMVPPGSTSPITYRPNARMKVPDIREVRRAIFAGIGIGLLPLHHLRGNEDQVQQIMPDYRFEQLKFYLVYRRRELLPKAQQVLIKQLLAGAPSITDAELMIEKVVSADHMNAETRHSP
ncbi:LysR family transcriptional regulator [Photobacterium frigidiphilum]|nr:LysR family transcriptional regulator [Photobacterium frigidiphilum]